MKIFLTGATGFIGSNIATYFSGHQVESFRRNFLDIRGQLNLFQPDWIINCAAEIYDRDKMWAANVELTKSCLDWVRTNPSTKMMHVGSSSEYGPSDFPTMEIDPIRATDMYGTTKGIATQLCVTYAKTYDLDVVVVRPYSPYGPGERPRRLFPALWRAFKLNQPMELVQGVHDFCYIDDFVEAVDTIIKSDRRTPGDIINISSGIQSTNMEVLGCFRTITGQQGAVTIVDRLSTPRVWRADISHIKTRYVWYPKTSLEEGIRQFLDKAYYE